MDDTAILQALNGFARVARVLADNLCKLTVSDLSNVGAHKVIYNENFNFSKLTKLAHKLIGLLVIEV